jgi:hypothetical protein
LAHAYKRPRSVHNHGSNNHKEYLIFLSYLYLKPGQKFASLRVFAFTSKELSPALRWLSQKLKDLISHPGIGPPSSAASRRST